MEWAYIPVVLVGLVTLRGFFKCIEETHSDFFDPNKVYIHGVDIWMGTSIELEGLEYKDIPGCLPCDGKVRPWRIAPNLAACLFLSSKGKSRYNEFFTMPVELTSKGKEKWLITHPKRFKRWLGRQKALMIKKDGREFFIRKRS